MSLPAGEGACRPIWGLSALSFAIAEATLGKKSFSQEPPATEKGLKEHRVERGLAEVLQGGRRVVETGLGSAPALP